MARIKVIIPETINTTISIPVRITDINYGNHLGNDALISIIHEARVQWLKQLNYSELDIEGTSLIMGDLAVEYLGESFYGDILRVGIAIDGFSRVGFELYYSISTSRNGTDLLIARAKTGMVCFDYNTRKIAAVPEKFRQMFKA